MIKTGTIKSRAEKSPIMGSKSPNVNNPIYKMNKFLNIMSPRLFEERLLSVYQRKGKGTR